MTAFSDWLYRRRETIPESEDLPRYVAPLPTWLEDVGLRAVWPVVVINLVGTVFGFWYYIPQFSVEPVSVWIFVPDSPTASLFAACAFGLWAAGRTREWVNALAFFGCIVLGLWTPYALTVFYSGFSYLSWPMYAFLYCSHLALVVEAFVLYRISDFPLRAVVVGFGWYLINVILDYFVPIVGTPHHTFIPPESTGHIVGHFLGQPLLSGPVVHPFHPHLLAAAGEVTTTLLATFLILATRITILETRFSD